MGVLQVNKALFAPYFANAEKSRGHLPLSLPDAGDDPGEVSDLFQISLLIPPVVTFGSEVFVTLRSFWFTVEQVFQVVKGYGMRRRHKLGLGRVPK